MAQYDLVIIGAGPAGMTAAIYAKRAKLNVLMLDKLSPGGKIIGTDEIQNYPGVGTNHGVDLAIQMFEHTQEMDIPYEDHTVIEIKDNGPAEKIVVCEDFDEVTEITTKTVIIATGTKNRTLHIPGEEEYIGHGICFCAICDGELFADKDIVVIGGGNSAVEESIYLTDIVKSLTVVTDFDLTADPVACDKLRSNPKVKIIPFQKPLEFLGDENLTGLRFVYNPANELKFTGKISGQFREGQEGIVNCDGVFEYIGQIPATDFAKSLLELDPYGNIPADSHMRTAVPGVFAAGDCIVKHLRQVVTAVSDGAIAAQEAAAYIKDLG